MAISEDEIIRDQAERDRLSKVIADAETALAISAQGTRRLIQNFVEHARARVVVLDKKIEEAKVERAAEVQAQVAAAALAAKETKLNVKERETYRGFLEESYFTKKDFGKLDEFYTHTYDRLSEGGKEEMSHRIWEGVRRDEYHFTDLPEVVQDKEAKRLYAKLTTPSVEQDSLNRIPEVDRTEFLHAYETGKQKEARQILNRDSFRQHVSLETSTGIKHQAVTTGRAADDQGVLANTPSPPSVATSPETSAMAKISQTANALKGVKLTSLNLGGLTLAETASAPSAASIPDASGPRVTSR